MAAKRLRLIHADKQASSVAPRAPLRLGPLTKRLATTPQGCPPWRPRKLLGLELNRVQGGKPGRVPQRRVDAWPPCSRGARGMRATRAKGGRGFQAPHRIRPRCHAPNQLADLAIPKSLSPFEMPNKDPAPSSTTRSLAGSTPAAMKVRRLNSVGTHTCHKHRGVAAQQVRGPWQHTGGKWHKGICTESPRGINH